MEILKNFKAWLTFNPILTNEDIVKYDFSKLDLEEEKRKYIESVEKYEPKQDIEKIKKELEQIKAWDNLKYIEILDFLKSYNITKEDIKKDFLLYLLEYNISDNDIDFEDVNNYLSGCYWDCFDNYENETISILELIENVIYNEFKIKE